MSTKRPPLALKAASFAAHAIAQLDPVKMATASAQAPEPVRAPSAPAPATAPKSADKPGAAGPAAEKARPAARQPSRAGKVQIVAWVAEGRRAELKIVAAKLRRTVDDLLTSMIDDLVTKHLEG